MWCLGMLCVGHSSAVRRLQLSAGSEGSCVCCLHSLVVFSISH